MTKEPIIISDPGDEQGSIEEGSKSLQMEVQQAYDKMLDELEPYNEEVKQAKQRKNDAIVELRKPLDEAIEAYYDAELMDAVGVPIKKGMVLYPYEPTKNDSWLVVEDRGMQFIFGKFMWNPSLQCRKIIKGVVQKKIVSISRFHTKEYRSHDLAVSQVGF